MWNIYEIYIYYLVGHPPNSLLKLKNTEFFKMLKAKKNKKEYGSLIAGSLSSSIIFYVNN